MERDGPATSYTPAGLQIGGAMSEEMEEMGGDLLESLFGGLRKSAKYPAECRTKAAQLRAIRSICI